MDGRIGGVHGSAIGGASGSVGGRAIGLVGLTRVSALIAGDDGTVLLRTRRPEGPAAASPGWEPVAGPLLDGEHPEQSLSRIVREQTGWEVGAILHDFVPLSWTAGGTLHVEAPYLVTVLADHRPRRRDRTDPVAQAEHEWVGPADLDRIAAVGATPDPSEEGAVSSAAVLLLVEQALNLLHAGELSR